MVNREPDLWLASELAPLSEEQRTLILKAVQSLVSALVGALVDARADAQIETKALRAMRTYGPN